VNQTPGFSDRRIKSLASSRLGRSNGRSSATLQPEHTTPLPRPDFEIVTMFECGDCGKAFPSGWRARDQHCDATGHRRPQFECDTCDAYFGSKSALWQHMSAKRHFSDDTNSYSHGSSDGYYQYPEQYWDCARCGESFVTEEGCNDHMIEDHLYCYDCDRYFMNYNNIKQVRQLPLIQPAGIPAFDSSADLALCSI
jgi:hypothetical protein